MIVGNAKNRTTVPSLTIVAGVAAVGVFFPIDSALRFTLIAAMGWAVAAIGLDLLVGFSGQLSFGQAAYVACGGYVVTALRVSAHMPLLLAVIVGVAFVAIGAAVIGGITVRLRSFGFAITTLFFGYVVITTLQGNDLARWFGGAVGLEVPAFPLSGPDHATAFYLVAVLILAVVVVLTCNLANSQTGRAMRLIKTNEVVAAASGIKVKRVKVLAFVYCCTLAAIGGVMYSAVVGSLGPDGFGLTQSVNIFAMVVVGGAGTVGGPILGALLITVLPSYYLRSGDDSAIAFAAALLVCLIVLPNGIYGLGESLVRFVGRFWKRIPGVARALGQPRRRLFPTKLAAIRDRTVLFPTSRRAAGGVVDEALAERTAEQQALRADIPELEVRDLEVRFDDFVALSEVNINVASRSIHAIVGPNGAGKTTLLNTISGFYTSSNGSVKLLGDSLTGVAADRIRMRGVVRTFQTPTMAPDLTVLDNVKLGLDADEKGWVLADLLGPIVTHRRERKLAAEAQWAIEAVGMPASTHKQQAEGLSLSEQKRVELARGLVGHGRLVLLDEPTAGLSVREMDELAVLLKELHQRFELTFVVISHHIGFILAIADELTVLDYGRVIGNGEPSEVLARPDIVETFTGADEPEATEAGEGVVADVVGTES